MARKNGITPNLPTYFCNQCNTEKPASEYYKNAKRSNGLQAYCKACNKRSGAEFRYKRPAYYWGDENELGYLEKNYDNFLQIIKKSTLADKSNKVYAIPTPAGTYIGCTSAHLSVRKASHKWTYLGHRKGLKKAIIPGLFPILDNYSIEEVDTIFNSMYILEEWEGDRKELLERERHWIVKFILEGNDVLNTRKRK
jgi:hypothetical protein